MNETVQGENEELVLDNMNIVTFETKMLLTNIRKLYISNNPHLELDFVDRLPNVEYLEINYCNLVDISNLPKLNKLNSLTIEGNYVKVFPSFKQIAMLDISNNQAELEYSSNYELKEVIFRDSHTVQHELILNTFFAPYTNNRYLVISRSTALFGFNFMLYDDRISVLNVDVNCESYKCLYSVFLIEENNRVNKSVQEICKLAGLSVIYFEALREYNERADIIAISIECCHECLFILFDTENKCYYEGLSCVDEQEIIKLVEYEEPKKDIENTPNISNFPIGEAHKEEKQKPEPLKFNFTVAEMKIGDKVGIVRLNCGLPIRNINYYASFLTKENIFEVYCGFRNKEPRQCEEAFINELINSHKKMIVYNKEYYFEFEEEAEFEIKCTLIGNGGCIIIPESAIGRLLFAEIEFEYKSYTISSIRSIKEGAININVRPRQETYFVPREKFKSEEFTPIQRNERILFELLETGTNYGEDVVFRFKSMEMLHVYPKVYLYTNLNVQQYNEDSQAHLYGYVLVKEVSYEVIDKEVYECRFPIEYTEIGKCLYINLYYTDNCQFFAELTNQIEFLHKLIDIECKCIVQNTFFECRITYTEQFLIEFHIFEYEIMHNDIFVAKLTQLLSIRESMLSITSSYLFELLVQEYFIFIDEEGFTSSFKQLAKINGESSNENNYLVIFIKNQALLLEFENLSDAEVAMIEIESKSNIFIKTPLTPIFNNFDQEVEVPILQEDKFKEHATYEANECMQLDHEIMYLLICYDNEFLIYTYNGCQCFIRPEWSACKIKAVYHCGIYKSKTLIDKVGGTCKSFLDEECTVFGELCSVAIKDGIMKITCENEKYEEFFNQELIESFNIQHGKYDNQIIVGCGTYSFVCEMLK